MNLKNSNVFLLVLFLIFACTKPKATYDDSQVFRYNEHSNILSLDPAFAKYISEFHDIPVVWREVVHKETLRIETGIGD